MTGFFWRATSWQDKQYFNTFLTWYESVFLLIKTLRVMAHCWHFDARPPQSNWFIVLSPQFSQWQTDCTSTILCCGHAHQLNCYCPCILWFWGWTPPCSRLEEVRAKFCGMGRAALHWRHPEDNCFESEVVPPYGRHSPQKVLGFNTASYCVVKETGFGHLINIGNIGITRPFYPMRQTHLQIFLGGFSTFIQTHLTIKEI